MAQLSELELLKASRNPLRVIDDIYKEAFGGYSFQKMNIELLKWYGMYPHINKDGLEDKSILCERIKLVDARMNLEQSKSDEWNWNKICKRFSGFYNQTKCTVSPYSNKKIYQLFLIC